MVNIRRPPSLLNRLQQTNSDDYNLMVIIRVKNVKEILRQLIATSGNITTT
uniref:Uncharacterized protein n=1 Tax=Anguilla anguilla TaxID=7936 RepID=A0A0E9QDE4_ANGAN